MSIYDRGVFLVCVFVKNACVRTVFCKDACVCAVCGVLAGSKNI